MNLDRLKSLIRLANNNPNEHESNLAARKACKIIAENDFALLYQNHVPRTAQEKVRTWNDVRRSTEPQWRSKTYDIPKKEPFAGGPFRADFDFNKWYETYFGGARYNPFKEGAWTDKAPHVDAPEDNSWDRETRPKNPYSSNFNDYNADGTRKKKREEMRKCAKCGLEIMTSRLKEDPWVCNPCHWKEYP